MYIFGAETRIRSLSRRAQQRRVYINIGVTRRRDAMDFWTTVGVFFAYARNGRKTRIFTLNAAAEKK